MHNHTPVPNVGLSRKQIDALPTYNFVPTAAPESPPTPTAPIRVRPRSVSVDASYDFDSLKVDSALNPEVDPCAMLQLPHGHSFRPALSVIAGSMDSIQPSMPSASVGLVAARTQRLSRANSLSQQGGRLALAAQADTAQCSPAVPLSPAPSISGPQSARLLGSALSGVDEAPPVGSHQLSGAFPDAWGASSMRASSLDSTMAASDSAARTAAEKLSEAREVWDSARGMSMPARTVGFQTPAPPARSLPEAVAAGGASRHDTCAVSLACGTSPDGTAVTPQERASSARVTSQLSRSLAQMQGAPSAAAPSLVSAAGPRPLPVRAPPTQQQCLLAQLPSCAADAENCEPGQGGSSAEDRVSDADSVHQPLLSGHAQERQARERPQGDYSADARQATLCPGAQGGATQFVCCICLEGYLAGEAVKMLPCNHRYVYFPLAQVGLFFSVMLFTCAACGQVKSARWLHHLSRYLAPF